MNESETRREDETTTDVPTSSPEVETTSSEETTTLQTTEEHTTAVSADEIAADESTTSEVTESTEDAKGAVTSEEEKEDKKEVASPVAAVLGAVRSVKQNWSRRHSFNTAAIFVVLVLLLAVLYGMERTGRIETGMFDGVNRIVSSYTPVAKVNDGKVTEFDLNVSMSQITAGAAAQGVDIESDEIKEEIKTRALDMLVNTELLKQEAKARGVAITDEDVDARLETLKTDVGGEEVLEQRMSEFNVNKKTLRRDIQNELTIQALLDQVFEEKNITVTDEEIAEFYVQAGGEEAGLPEIDAVRAQIEEQIRTGKEQEVVTAYIEELRSKATIEILI